MSLRKTLEVIARLAAQGTIEHYAVAGAVAALKYVQPTLTEDIHILVSIKHFDTRSSGLVLLAPIENALADMGYSDRRDVGVVIEGWPVQFLPAASELDEEALDHATETPFEPSGNPPLAVRCLTAEYLVAIALRVGRLKDLARIQAFVARGVLNREALKDILIRHGLMQPWQSFCAKAGFEDWFAKE